MRDRKIILRDIIHLDGDINELRQELSQYPWDSKISVEKICKSDFSEVFDKYLNGIIGNKDIEDWANLIECREDLGFEDEDLQELIFELASPEINGYLTKEKVREIQVRLSL